MLPGCEGEVAALFSLAFGTALGAWLVSRDRQHRALHAAENLRHAIQTGQQFGMQTLDQNLTDLVRRNVISPAEARAKAKIPENFPG